MHFLGLANCIWHRLCNLCNETLAWVVSLLNHVFTSPRLFPVLCHQCTCTKQVWRHGHFIRNYPGRTQASKQKCMSTRNTEDPTRSGEFRQGFDFQIVYLLCIQGPLFSQFSRLPNDLWTTSERHQDFSQNDQLSTKNHRLQTIHPMCAAFQVIDLIAICSTHGFIFPVTLSNFSAMFQYGPAMGLWKRCCSLKKNCWTKLSLRIWCSWKQLWCSCNKL